MQRLDINSVHTQVDDNLRKYLTRKIGHLDKYLSRHDRSSAHAEIMLKEGRVSGKKQFTCEVTMHVPGDVINVSETTLNMFAAIDIVEAKLKQQIKKHKDLRQNGKLHRRLFTRLGRKIPSEA